MSEDDKIYEIKRPNTNVVYASIKDAKLGLKLIKDALEEKGWDTPTNYELGRTEIVDIGREHKLGDAPGALRLKIPATPDMWNQVEAALQHSKALLRKSGKYDASPIECSSPAGNTITIIANNIGQMQITKNINELFPETALAATSR